MEENKNEIDLNNKYYPEEEEEELITKVARVIDELFWGIGFDEDCFEKICDYVFFKLVSVEGLLVISGNLEDKDFIKKSTHPIKVIDGIIDFYRISRNLDRTKEFINFLRKIDLNFEDYYDTMHLTDDFRRVGVAFKKNSELRFEKLSSESKIEKWGDLVHVIKKELGE